jgi:hypothetical protein
MTTHTSRTSVDKRSSPIAARIATHCFPDWQGSHIVIVEANAKWHFRPVDYDATNVKILDLVTFTLELGVAIAREYRTKPGHAVVMSRGVGISDVVAIVIPAIDASERAVCLDALLERRVPDAITLIETHGRDHCTAELVCAVLDKQARVLEEKTAVMPYV